MRKTPEVGEKVRFIGCVVGYGAITFGGEYEVIQRSEEYAVILDDKQKRRFLKEGNEKYEIVADVYALIANLGRRLHEVETALETAKERDYYVGMVEAYSDMSEEPVDVKVADRPAQIGAVCDKVRDLLIRKNHDYGDSFAQQYAKYGLQSALIRMDDKMRRLETLADGEQAQVAESIEDTLMDLAGYALLALVEASE
ncbi:DUF1599 domain-containing protein [Sporosarcina psychrophila]|uniref:Nucleotide modification associated domain-containing protein n=1 Tax=Sporosarcina psychrophila TaxID=1476 RepID=A0ABV2KBN2_SPOPS